MRALRIGLTGGLGAGKSLALRALSGWGAATIDADQIAREQAAPGGPAYRRIVAAFGPSIVGRGGALDRAKLARLAFGSARQRRKLEAIAHPLIVKELLRRLRAAKKGLVFAAVPLLFEAGLEEHFDLTMTIEAPASTRRRRARRRGLSEEEARSRMRAQLPDRERARRADVALSNRGSRRRFVAALRSYYKGLELLRLGAAAR